MSNRPMIGRAISALFDKQAGPVMRDISANASDFATTTDLETLTDALDRTQRECRDLRLRVAHLEQSEASLAAQMRLTSLAADVGLALTGVNELPDALQSCAQAVVDRLDAAFARIWTLNDAQQMLELRASAGLYTHLNGPHGRVPVGKFKIGMIAQERKPHVTNHVIGDTRIGDQDWARRMGMVAFAGYPLILDETLVGVLAMFAQRPLAQWDVDALGTVARSVSMGIARARAIEALRESDARHRLSTDELEREQQARLNAESANRAKDEFLANLSHELRTPLNAILGWVKLLGGGHLDTETTARAFQIIERNTRTQAQLIDDLLDVSRITTGKLQLDCRVAPVQSIIDGALESVRHAADEKKITIEIEAGRAGETLWCDPGRLQQVIWNLLSNAIKFTPEAGRVTVRVEHDDTCFTVTVSDTGAGIDPRFLPHVFDRFRQQDPAFARTLGGLGLGLSIVRHVVELHGGSVTGHSDGAGRGAKFVVTIPIANPSSLIPTP
jgi:signal transduction histidine kinase